MTTPTGAASGYLTAVACGSTTSCRAVGYYVTSSSVTKNLAEHWNGAKWSAEMTASPSAKFSYLTGVACPSATSCEAVGEDQGSAGDVTCAERWNGSRWSLVRTPAP